MKMTTRLRLVQQVVNALFLTFAAVWWIVGMQSWGAPRFVFAAVMALLAAICASGAIDLRRKLRTVPTGVGDGH